jgi:hypothetical protein
MTGRLNAAVATLPGRYRTETAPQGSVPVAPFEGESESESILPAILVSVLTVCILAALSGTLGMLLHMALRRMT